LAREHAGDRGGDDLIGFGPDCHGGRDAKEDQQRRHEEATADAEQAGQEPDRPAQAEQKEDVHGDLGDGQIDLHRSEHHSTAARRPKGMGGHWTWRRRKVPPPSTAVAAADSKLTAMNSLRQWLVQQ
jgi:hypothetical protein